MNLFRSRKFMLLLFDAVISTILMVLTPFEDAVFSIVAIQPALIALIVAITIEDVNRATEFDPIPPLLYLIKSGRFWLVILDIVITLFGYFGLKYMNPDSFETARWTVMTFKPVIVTMIAAVTGENIENDYKEFDMLEAETLNQWLTERLEQTDNDNAEAPLPGKQPE